MFEKAIFVDTRHKWVKHLAWDVIVAGVLKLAAMSLVTEHPASGLS